MKRIALIVLMGMMGMHAIAQDNSATSENETKKPKKTKRYGDCPGIYITTSTGINNNTGILGFSFDVPVSKSVSIDAGPGTGTWGYKVYLGAKYYLRPCHRGFAFGAGFTYCPGVHNDQHDLTTIYGISEPVVYNKNPLTNILFAAYKYWNLGRGYNRIYMELGWSVPLGNYDKVTQVAGDPISSDTRHALNSNAPGGPILAAGFSFGMH